MLLTFLRRRALRAMIYSAVRRGRLGLIFVFGGATSK